jgi:hypothetical protein
MCEYCETVQYKSDPWDATTRLWFKTFKRDDTKAKKCLFYRGTDENPWYFDVNGSITPITECPVCRRDLQNVRYLLVWANPYAQHDSEYYSKVRKAYSKKFYQNTRTGVLMPIDEENPDAE